METRIAVIAIIVENRDSAEEINRLLHLYGEYIVGRMGVPYKPKQVSVISVILDAPQDKISALSGKLGMLPGVSSKTVYSKEQKKNSMKEIRENIDRLAAGTFENDAQSYGKLIAALSREEETQGREYLFEKARKVQQQFFGNRVYIRGLIEISNVCKNDCYYCGIRKSNSHISRYRLTREEILKCCQDGYERGFRTFVLQGGEDPELCDEKVEKIVAAIHENYPDCAITLSLGEREKESYQRFFDAGAERYLLRHETADERHYRRLHPPALHLEHRMKCLEDLKAIGYQIGCGCMIGSPFQTAENLGQDLVYMKKLQPHMVGIGPFISQKDTPFKDFANGTLTQTLVMLGMIRLLLPKALLPATTALGTIHPRGRELGILAGANVVMPNLSPGENRKKYLLYDNKLGTGEESAEGLELLKSQMRKIGYEVVVSRGDSPGMERKEQ